MDLAALMPDDWRELLADEIAKPYFKQLEAYVAQELATQTVYPAPENIFAALWRTPVERVKVLLLGQDPYHGPGQAHGLSFSVLPGTPFPPSLRNIFKELHTDHGCAVPKSGDLGAWADQGVLLLNAVLTVRAGEAASHKARGWEKFTDAVIRKLSEHKQHVVFLLWGNYAKKKKALIDAGKHVVIEGIHPSPLSASNGFFGSKPFSAINQALGEWGCEPIDWRL
ncbi:MAG: uracil-DNA glycosylase [Candidatus Sericytochromatia bacterium]